MKRFLTSFLVLTFLTCVLAGGALAAERSAAATSPKPPVSLCIAWDGGVESILTFKNFKTVRLQGGPAANFAVHGVHIGSVPFPLAGSAYTENGIVHFTFTIATQDVGVLVWAVGAGTWDIQGKTGSLSYSGQEDTTAISGTATLSEVSCAEVSLSPPVARGSRPANLITNQ